MKVDADLLFLPYAARDDRSLVQVLVEQLEKGVWDRFRAAVAFANRSGNFPRLIKALQDFAEGGGTIDLTFSADDFGHSFASEYEAIEELLRKFEDYPSASVYLYRSQDSSNPPWSFHPKVYLFSNDDRALLIVGSSNWGQGGMAYNVEANVLLRLDKSEDDHRARLEQVENYFNSYWQEDDDG